MANPSYYFTLFPKLQVLAHIPESATHGGGASTGGFNLDNPDSIFTPLPKGRLIHATSTTPADSPLWTMFNERAVNPGASNVMVGGVSWRVMPLFVTPAWTQFQGSIPSLVDTFGDWITAGKINDIPANALSNKPSQLTIGLDTGISLFVCSVANDNGIRPGTVPSNYWATSLIYLVNPGTGNTESPSTLAAGSEYFLVGIVGNRGNENGGTYSTGDPTKIEATAWVMVWNSGMSPAVQLPALSNLDTTSTAGSFELYHLFNGDYALVGFRLNVQDVFDGLVKAVAQSGANLGGLTPLEWVHASGAHLCAKLLVRQVTDPWPAFGDTPFDDPRIAQKNLAPFEISLAVSDPDPDITWKNFMVGDVIKKLIRLNSDDDRIGWHEFEIHTEGIAQRFGFLLAVPRRSFIRWLENGLLQGIDVLSDEEAKALHPPFRDVVVLRLSRNQPRFALPPLGETILALSLGIQFSRKRMDAGDPGQISLIQSTIDVQFDRNENSYGLKPIVVGGFSFELNIHTDAIEEQSGSDAKSEDNELRSDSIASIELN